MARTNRTGTLGGWADPANGGLSKLGHGEGMQQLFRSLFARSLTPDQQRALEAQLQAPAPDADTSLQAFTPFEGDSLEPYQVAANSVYGNTYNGTDMLNMAKMYGKTHPIASLATGAGALANVGGLMDNDKLGGQLIGGLLGGLGGHFLGGGGLSTLQAGLAGGALGSLFDKLRAKRESQSKQLPQNSQRR